MLISIDVIKYNIIHEYQTHNEQLVRGIYSQRKKVTNFRISYMQLKTR